MGWIGIFWHRPKLIPKHIHEMDGFRLGPCPVCKREQWIHISDCVNESICACCGCGIQYPYDVGFDEGNDAILKRMGIKKYNGVERKFEDR